MRSGSNNFIESDSLLEDNPSPMLSYLTECDAIHMRPLQSVYGPYTLLTQHSTQSLGTRMQNTFSSSLKLL